MEGLDDNLLTCVISYVDVADLVSLLRTCHSFRRLILENANFMRNYFSTIHRGLSLVKYIVKFNNITLFDRLLESNWGNSFANLHYDLAFYLVKKQHIVLLGRLAEKKTINLAFEHNLLIRTAARHDLRISARYLIRFPSVDTNAGIRSIQDTIVHIDSRLEMLNILKT